jgi:hypothetical protein
MNHKLALLLAIALLTGCASPPPPYYAGGSGSAIICQPVSLYDHSGVMICR